MDLIIYAAAAVLVVMLTPFLRILIKRVSARGKIIRGCRECGAGFYPSRRIWWLISRGSDCDFVALSGDTAFAVKLMATRYRNSAILFKEDYITVTRRVSMISNWGVYVSLPARSKTKHLPSCAVTEEMKTLAARRAIRRCLLISPVCAELSESLEGGKTRTVCSGDNVGAAGELTVYDVGGFVSALRRAANSGGF